MNTHTLSNGLRIAHLPVTDSDICYCGFAINAGSRQEKKNEHGLAHFVEHTIFKGTSKRKAWHILNRMENVGGELNAYTTKENTFIYSIFMEKDLERAVELMTDLVVNSVFPAKELDKERDVIADEIESYEDSPAEIIFDDFENILFGEHPLGHNILGNRRSLRTFDATNARRFVNNYYTAGNMVFFTMTKTHFSKIIRIAEKYMCAIPPDKPDLDCFVPRNDGEWNGFVPRNDGECDCFVPRNDGATTVIANAPSVIANAPSVIANAVKQSPPPAQIIKKKHTHLSHILIGSHACNIFDPRRYSLYLLSNVLGGPGMNSRLNVSLREKRGLVYNVEANFHAYSDAGLFSVYLGAEKKKRSLAIELVEKELARLRNSPLSDVALRAAKKQAVGQLCVAADNRENKFLSLGKAFLYTDSYETLPEIIAHTEEITAKQLLDVANETFPSDKLYTLIFE